MYKINVSGDEKKYPQLEIPACYANQLLVIHLQQTNSDLPHFHELATDGNEDEQVSGFQQLIFRVQKELMKIRPLVDRNYSHKYALLFT